MTIPIDPDLPEGFFDRHHDKRTLAEIDAWWDKPFALTEGGSLAVYCLDGGVQNRPSFYGMALDEALAAALAQEKLQAWLKKRQLPIVQAFEEGGFGVFKMGQRPWEDSDLLEEFESKADAEEFMKKLD